MSAKEVEAPRVGDQIELVAPWGHVKITHVDRIWVAFDILELDKIRDAVKALKERYRKGGMEISPKIDKLLAAPKRIKRKHWARKIERSVA